MKYWQHRRFDGDAVWFKSLWMWWHWGTIAGAVRRTVAARTESVVVGVFFCSAFAECSEAVGECQHEVAGDGVVFAVLYVVGGHAPRYVLFLVQQIVGAQAYGCLFAFEELI